MSTTFRVYPRSGKLPSFGELLDRSTSELHTFLGAFGIRARPKIHVRLQRKSDHAHLPFAVGDPLRWGSDTYAWFMVGDVPGGTDAYFDDDSAANRESWEGELHDPKFRPFESMIRKCVDVGHYWWFRRSAGQPAVINITYGLVAGSLAALTDGFIHSDDSAWDWQRMPAHPADFLGYYFRPDLALEEDFQNWSRRCIAQLPAELDGADRTA